MLLYKLRFQLRNITIIEQYISIYMKCLIERLHHLFTLKYIIHPTSIREKLIKLIFEINFPSDRT